MEAIEGISVEPCTNSRFVQPYRVKYTQNGQQKFWDCTKIHDSIAVLIFNRTKKTFVLVRQFRPAVYMSKHRHLWENSDVFSNALSLKPSPTNTPTEPAISPQQPASSYGPGALGCTYELCAGIVDKQVPLEQIAKEEVLEETGYDVPVENMEFVTSYYSSIGHAGSHQTMYYCEVTEEMLVSKGGGNSHEGELIEVVHVPLEDSMKMVFDGERARSTGMCFAFTWFEHFKKPKLNL